MDKKLLGQILASVVLGALEAGEIVLDPSRAMADQTQLNSVVNGFISIWITHPASSGNEKAAAAGV